MAVVALAACSGQESDRVELLALGEVEQMQIPAADGSTAPNLATGHDGTVYLTWIEPSGDSAHALRFATWRGTGWDDPITVAEGSDWFVNWADFPSIFPGDGTSMGAHYLQRDRTAAGGFSYGVRIVRSEDGGRSWSAPVVPHRDTAVAEHGFVSMFPLPGDSIAAVWLDGRNFDPAYGGTKNNTLRITAFAADGTVGADRVLDERVCECCQTSAAVAAGVPIVVYRGRSPEEIRDVMVTRYVSGAWSSPSPISRDGWEIEACPVNGPAVAASSNRVAVAWFTAARDTSRVLVAFSEDAGATFGTPIRLDAGDPEGRVDVEILRDGRAIVSWLERGGRSGGQVIARIAEPGGQLGGVALVGPSASMASGFPRMAVAGESVIFAWTDTNEPSGVRVVRAPLVTVP